MKDYALNINGKKVQVNADPETPMLWVLRDYVELKGTKFGCGMGLCGACTIHLDGQAVRSCQTPISSVQPSSKIVTIEGVTEGLHSPTIDKVVQNAWIAEQVPQCGYCQSGQIMSAVSLLKSNPNPTDADIDNFMAGNICRCGTYVRIRKAIHLAASELKLEKSKIKSAKTSR